MDRFRLACWCAIILLSAATSHARVIRVGAAYNFKTIGSAIIQAHPGDTVEVWGGVYNENVIIDKSIQLRGIHSPSVNARNKGNVMLIQADNVIVEGFRLENSGRSSLHEYCGIRAVNCNGTVIRNNVCLNNSIGINLQKCTRGIISGNKVTTNINYLPVQGNAIHCWSCDTLAIIQNQVSNHRDGIYLEFVSASQINRNVVHDCMRYGLHFMFSHYDEYHYNTFRRNGAGVAVMYSHQVNMTFNLFELNVSDISYGLLLKDIYDGMIAHNTFLENSVAIYMDDTHDVQIRNNHFEKNGMGIRMLASSYENCVSDNNFISNTYDVTTNSSSTNNNTFSGNYWDKYNGYDLNKDGYGDVPHHPLSLFSMFVEHNPMAMLFFRSIIANMLDLSERISPTMTPENFVDEKPAMRRKL